MEVFLFTNAVAKELCESVTPGLGINNAMNSELNVEFLLDKSTTERSNNANFGLNSIWIETNNINFMKWHSRY